jgi:sporulation protein YlmC with PRC-barrel domain
MAEPAEFMIGARASCSDGPCGEVRRVIIDPAAGTITHLVIDPGHDPARLVPLHLVDAAAGDIRLRCSLAEFGELDRAEETDIIEDMGQPGGPLTGMGVGTVREPSHVRTFVTDAVPRGEAEVSRGEPVHAVDGEIGRVHGFLVSPDDERVTHVLLEEGHLWGRKEVAIPISAVTSVDDGIRLSITKKQVEDLPPVD